ncbi:acetyl-CoA carboxylase biotin carboxyl carrier protein [Geodermatophilus saharensis]|uniref:Biotin carboxyl carrier protein of acetyl-CoA carboxylase n=1 Tax=Geodermatophilus saharensis TaxID=1137994 RepID=A0A239H4E1_9ACTN|nr:acetyl-CoA carboxylase biotin carboxyl carrier protein [Geodermatophilus saharensis]SNS75114.1 acetyl-CoA carboxylase biotin carboxyl carrier protein [Geodermatophilus saharensis]
MRPAELPPRSGAGGGEDRDDATRSLQEEIVDLARALPGPLRRLTVRSGDRSVEVEWAADVVVAPAAAPAAAPASGALQAVTPAAATAPESPAAAPEVPEGTVPVRAPLVGTFYTAPSPGAEPFVRVGDEVEAGQTLGIVEAMKLMNPIVADSAGVVTEVRVGDAESVEYDQVLLLLRPPGGSR